MYQMAMQVYRNSLMMYSVLCQHEACIWELTVGGIAKV